MGPYGSKIFKTLLLPQIAFESCQLFLKFLLSGPHKSTVLDFFKFWVYDFSQFFVSINMRLYGSQTFKTLLPEMTFESFESFSEYSSHYWSSQKFCFEYLKFLVFYFSGFFFFFFVFVNMGPYVSQNFKPLLLPQNTIGSFQPFPKFSSQWSSQKYCFRFLKFRLFWFLTIFKNSPLYLMGKPKTSSTLEASSLFAATMLLA